ncbi:MAG TPA: pilus assembly protein TadB, partial [Brevundimonas sp.]|nr:pilus assembly protein TadB [Brevundimonas sp.]
MDLIQIFLVFIGAFALLGIAIAGLSGPSMHKQVQRRLSGVRYRHSESTEARVESQMKKAMAARKPKVQRVAGAGSRTEALALRLERTGKRWTVSQYLYVSFGLALVVGLILYLQSGVPLLSLIGGLLIG